MDVGDAQLLQVVHAHGHAVLVDKPLLGEGQVLALVLRRTDQVGEVTDVNLPDDGLGVGIDGVLQGIGIPALGVGLREIHHHGAVAVQTRGLAVGVGGGLGTDGGGDGVGVVGAVTAGLGVAPDTLLPAGHGNALDEGIGVTVGVEIQLDLGGGGSPDLEGGLIPADNRAQVGAVVVEVLGEILAVKDVHGHHGLFAVALDLHAVALGEIQSLLHLDVARGGLAAHGGDAHHLQLTVALVDLDLAVVLNGNLGVDAVLDLMLIRHTRQGKILDHIECLSSVIALVLVAVPGLEVDEGLLALNGDEAVLVEILGGVPPGGAAGLGAVLADDEANLRYVLGDIDHDLGAVAALVEQVALTGYIAPPDPHIAVLIAAVVGPVEGDLVAALLRGELVFVLGDGGVGLPLGLRGIGSVECVGIDRGLAGHKQCRQNHEQRQKQRRGSCAMCHCYLLTGFWGFFSRKFYYIIDLFFVQGVYMKNPRALV